MSRNSAPTDYPPFSLLPFGQGSQSRAARAVLKLMSAEQLIQPEKPLTKTGARKLKTMLLFPPEWVPTAPYLALPSLTAVLRAQGHDVIQKDINIEMYDIFFSDTFLIWVMARMSMQLSRLGAKEMSAGLTDREADQKAL